MVAAVEKVTDPPRKLWVLENPITTFFLTAASAWAYSLWVGNKSYKLREQAKEDVTAAMPATSDELLELRFLNELPTTTFTEDLPRRLKKATKGAEAAPRATVLACLRDAVTGGSTPLKEEYVVERVLMAIPDAEEELPAGQPSKREVDTTLTASALCFLSSGSATERFEAMFDVLRGGARSIDTDTLRRLLDALMLTGQMPPEKIVHVHDAGELSLLGVTSVRRSWYTVEEASAATPAELCEDLMALTADDAATAAQADGPGRVELERFIAMMQSERACIWNECRRIAERRALEKEALEAEEYAANPPFYQRWYNAVAGGGGSSGGAAA